MFETSYSQGLPKEKQIGEYILLRRLGAGGFAEVYLAHHKDNPDELVAIKILRREGHRQEEMQEYRARFELEARIGFTYNLPHVIRILTKQPIEWEGHLCQIMQYMPGGSLADWIRRIQQGEQDPVDLHTAIRIGREIATGLAALHKRNLIHRDIKPENILLDEAKQAFIGDLGLVQTPGSRIERERAGSLNQQRVGDPRYAPPEQKNGLPSTPASDVYMWGATLFELLTTKPYWKALGRRVRDFRPDIPKRLDDIIARALQEAPQDRFQSMDEVLDALNQGILRSPSLSWPRLLISMIMIILFSAGISLSWWTLTTKTSIFTALKPVPTAYTRPSEAPPGAMVHPTQMAPTPWPTIANRAIKPPQYNLFVEYLIDASNGMMQPWTQNTEPKLASIQRVLPEIWRATANNMYIGLRVYGHRLPSVDPQTCNDVELLRPIRQWDPEDLIAPLFGLRAQGLDSATKALREAYGDFQYRTDRLNAVIFLTEGGDTCGNDPLSLIEAQREIGVVLPILVVALEPPPEERLPLNRLADESGGQYFEVYNPTQLYETLMAITKTLLQTAP